MVARPHARKDLRGTIARITLSPRGSFDVIASPSCGDTKERETCRPLSMAEIHQRLASVFDTRGVLAAARAGAGFDAAYIGLASDLRSARCRFAPRHSLIALHVLPRTRALPGFTGSLPGIRAKTQCRCSQTLHFGASMRHLWDDFATEISPCPRSIVRNPPQQLTVDLYHRPVASVKRPGTPAPTICANHHDPLFRQALRPRHRRLPASCGHRLYVLGLGLFEPDDIAHLGVSRIWGDTMGLEPERTRGGVLHASHFTHIVA